LIVKWEKFKCVVCGYIYDPDEGDSSSGIQPALHSANCLLIISVLFVGCWQEINFENTGRKKRVSFPAKSYP